MILYWAFQTLSKSSPNGGGSVCAAPYHSPLVLPLLLFLQLCGLFRLKCLLQEPLFIFLCFYENQSWVIDLATAVGPTHRMLKGWRGPEHAQCCLLFRSGSPGTGDEGP